MTELLIPSDEEIYKNFLKWKKYINVLNEKLNLIEHKIDLEEYKKNAIITIDNLFKAYIIPLYPIKIFNSDKVLIDSNCINSSYNTKKYTYNFDGIDIFYHGRIAIIGIDLDYHIDIRISVDDTVIYEKKPKFL
jgi:hypothetical protein